MGVLRRKNKQTHMLLLQAEASSAPETPESPSPTETPPRQSSTSDVQPPREQSSREGEQQEETAPNGDTGPPEDMLDATFIGRTIKLVRAENWEQDLLPTFPQETYILYENQRGYILTLLPTTLVLFNLNVGCSSSENPISVAIRSSNPSNSIPQHIKTQIPSSPPTPGQ